MAKWISLLLPLLLLTACSAGGKDGERQEPPDTAAVADQEVLPQTEEPLCYRVEARLWEDEARAEDGTILASYSFRLPELTLCRRDGTAPDTRETEEKAAIIETFNAHFGRWAAAEEFPELVREAEEQLSWCRGEELEWFGYALGLDCAVYQTEHLISVAGTYYSYTGGAHPNTWQLGWNFDLESGSFFGPEGLAADSAAFQAAMEEELVRQAGEIALENGMAPEEMFWQDYESILANWSSYAVYFDNGGMTVVFSPYELAAYGFGPQEFFFSYDWLLPHLSDHGRQVLELEPAE